MQVDVTEDGIGQADFDRLKKLYSKAEMESKQMKRLRKYHNNDKDINFRITNDNDWKFEFVISQGSNKIIRSKIYSKTADKLTSTGVSNKKTVDPLPNLVLTYDENG